MTTRTTAPQRRARLLRYVPWIMRDYLSNQGPSTALVVVLIGFMTMLPILKTADGARLGHLSPIMASRILRELAIPLAFLGTFFATNGLISNDRKFGFFRFQFAKPVRPTTYYAAIFAVYGLGLLVVTAMLLGVWALVARPMFPVGLFAVVAIMYVAYGGIGFMLSAAWRFDWLSLVSVLLVANFAWAVWGGSDSPARWLLYALPPVHKADDVYALLTPSRFTGPRWSSMLWLSGYGFASFLLGLVVLRKRPLGTS